MNATDDKELRSLANHLVFSSNEERKNVLLIVFPSPQTSYSYAQIRINPRTAASVRVACGRQELATGRIR